MALGPRCDDQSTPAVYRASGRARIGLPTRPPELVLCATTDRRVIARDREIISPLARNCLDPIDRVAIVFDHARVIRYRPAEVNKVQARLSRFMPPSRVDSTCVLAASLTVQRFAPATTFTAISPGFPSTHARRGSSRPGTRAAFLDWRRPRPAGEGPRMRRGPGRRARGELW